MGKTLKNETSPDAKATGDEPAVEKPPAEQPSAEQPAGASRKVRGRVFIDEERCKGCGLCIAFCPSDVLEFSARFNKKGYHPPEIKRPEVCTGCDLCGHYCPDFAIFGVRVKDDPPDKEKKEQ